MNEKAYIPIACHNHDYIEHVATLKLSLPIIYLDANQNHLKIQDRIVNWINDGEAEYMILENHVEKIRLDMIIKIGEIEFQDKNCSLQSK